MIELTVKIPDTELARAALGECVQKLVSAHERSVKAKAAIEERKEKERQEYLAKRYGTPQQEEAEDKVVIPDCLNDLTVNDLRSIVKQEGLKLGKGKKSADQYKEALAELSNIDDLVSGYKLEQAGGFS